MVWEWPRIIERSMKQIFIFEINYGSTVLTISFSVLGTVKVISNCHTHFSRVDKYIQNYSVYVVY